MPYRGKLEYAQARTMRERNTRLYRLAHWPLWIWVFFLAPGPLTFSLFAHGFGRGNLAWLALVLLGTGIAASAARSPAAEPRPYILRFDEDKPNPLYRRVCYTFAWNAVLSFALLNLAGLIIAAATGVWYMKQIYTYAYAPLCAIILLLGATGLLPRVRPPPKAKAPSAATSTARVWAVVVAQAVLMLAWKTLPATHTAAIVKLIVFVATLTLMAFAARRGAFPRTRPIVPGELMVAD